MFKKSGFIIVQFVQTILSFSRPIRLRTALANPENRTERLSSRKALTARSTAALSRHVHEQNLGNSDVQCMKELGGHFSGVLRSRAFARANSISPRLSQGRGDNCPAQGKRSTSDRFAQLRRPHGDCRNRPSSPRPSSMIRVSRIAAVLPGGQARFAHDQGPFFWCAVRRSIAPRGLFARRIAANHRHCGQRFPVPAVWGSVRECGSNGSGSSELFQDWASSCRAAIRFSVLGWVENRLSIV